MKNAKPEKRRKKKVMCSMTNHLFDPGFDDTEVVFIKLIKGSILASLLFFFIFYQKGGLIR